MRIEELLENGQNLEEGPGWDAAKQGLKQVGQGAGNIAKGAALGAPGAIGGAVKGISAVAGGLAGAWDQAKAGFSAGRKAVGGKAAPGNTTTTAAGGTNTTAPAANTTAPVAGGTAPVAGGTAPVAGGTAPVAGGTAPVAPTPAQQQQAAQQAKIGIGQINKIIPTLKTDQLNAIKKVIDQRTQALAAKRPAQTVTGTQAPAAAPAATPAAATTGVQTQAPLANPAINPAAQQAFGAARTFESVEFHSKFLNQKI